MKARNIRLRGSVVLALAIAVLSSCATTETRESALPVASGNAASRSSAPSESERTSPAASPTASPRACAVTPCPPNLPVFPGGFGETLVASPVWSRPGEGEPVDIGLQAGMGVWVSETLAGEAQDWYRIQAPLRSPAPPTFEYAFGWLPATVDGSPTLTKLAPYSTGSDYGNACPDELSSLWQLAGADPPLRAICGSDVSITLEGYFGEVREFEQPVFGGEPAWLADEPTLVLWSAVGPAAEGFQLPVHLDPGSPVTVASDLLSDREGSVVRPVHVTGHFGDRAADSCRRSPRLTGFLPMSEQEQQGWCRQQFVVDQIHAGDWLEPDLSDLDSCENAEAGFRVSFPDSWYTNTAYAGNSACQFFNPGPFVVTAGRPAQGVAVDIGYVPTGSGIGRFSSPIWSEDVTVAGRPAVRSAWAGTGQEGSHTT